ncbi:TRAP transporter small permease [Aquabacterium sp.]|uniref:TRAP transporter small permease n=1 Tax=Aquabacterium sp. TaxID=1872578 RepID=UPI0035B43904
MKWLDHLEEWLIATFMGAATLITFIAVVHRYAVGFSSPLQNWLLGIDMAWAQEATIYLFVWMAKFGAAYGVRTGIHVGVDVLINRLEPGKRRFFVLFGLLAGALFTGAIATMGAGFVWHNGADFAFHHAMGMDTSELIEGPTTPDLEWPTWIIYLAIPLGSSLMCFRFLQVAWNFARGGELPHHDHGHVDGLDDDEPAKAST